jgi:uncharacterized protein YndB with AHSA1/START domain
MEHGMTSATTGNYVTVDGRPALHFERRLPHPVEKVWRAVTEPDRLAAWFPARVDGDLRVGGELSFEFEDHDLPEMSGKVIEYDPPRRFAFTWGDDEVRFEIEPASDGAGSVLRFTHVLDERDKAARDAAGWEVCLDRLTRSLDGESTTSPSSAATTEWRTLYERYVEQGFPSGAPIPGEG